MDLPELLSPAMFGLGDLWAALAQLVEHIIRNDGVGCSNHPSGTILSYSVSVSSISVSSMRMIT